MHLGDEQLQRILHREVAPAEEDAMDRHLAECSECRLRLEESRREERWVHDLLTHLDAPAPAVVPGTLARRAEARTVALWARRAAGIVLVLGIAGVAYTAPGSPVHAWMDRLAGWISAPRSSAPPPPEEVAPPAGTSGIAVVPGPRFTIRFTGAAPEGIAAVSMTEGAQVVVRVLSGGATFASDSDQLTIETHASPASYEIELPRGAPWVEIVAHGGRLLLKQGPVIVTDAPADSRGRHLLTLRARNP